VQRTKPNRVPGGWEGRVWMAPDFDEPDPELEKLFYHGPIASNEAE